MTLTTAGSLLGIKLPIDKIMSQTTKLCFEVLMIYSYRVLFENKIMLLNAYDYYIVMLY